jgi:ATPase subunit of ABC transporter with duplicated ATPase domains
VIVASGIAMQFEAKPLFSDVSVKFGGSGKSTIMKILRGELELAAS